MRAGERLAGLGGNAVDAALAALLVTTVNEPGVVALGGGAFVTVAAAGEEPVVIDGSVAMPGIGRPAAAFGRGLRRLELAYGGGTSMHVGHGSVAVPGTPAAAAAAHRRYGRAPWAEVVAPAAELARSGFPVGSAAAEYLGHAAGPIFGIAPPAAGELMHLPGLAEFLERLAAEGPAAFYAGDVAAALLAEMAAGDGLIGPADLAAYRAVARRPLSVPAGCWRLWLPPPPSVGGAALAAMLVLLRDGWDVARLVDVQRRVLGYRVTDLEAAGEDPAVAEELLERLRVTGPSPLRAPSTAHVSVVDAEGTACAITTSAGYGSGVSVPGTGIWLNNCLGEQELMRGGWAGRTPGLRLVSNMAPVVGRGQGGEVLAIGSPGADRITTAILQTLLGLLAGDDPAAAVCRPRLHLTCDDTGRAVRLEHEADVAVPPEVAPDVPRRRHPPLSMFFGGVGVTIASGGRLVAAADPRRSGAVGVG